MSKPDITLGSLSGGQLQRAIADHLEANGQLMRRDRSQADSSPLRALLLKSKHAQRPYSDGLIDLVSTIQAYQKEYLPANQTTIEDTIRSTTEGMWFGRFLLQIKEIETLFIRQSGSWYHHRPITFASSNQSSEEWLHASSSLVEMGASTLDKASLKEFLTKEIERSRVKISDKLLKRAIAQRSKLSEKVERYLDSLPSDNLQLLVSLFKTAGFAVTIVDGVDNAYSIKAPQGWNPLK